MRRSKTLKWRENIARACVYEPPVREIAEGGTFMRGQWRSQVFGHDGPLTLELGCGRGEYTLELARRYPQRNHLGVDIKGHRFWFGAKRVEQEQLTNAAFLRARIEYMDHFFAPGEVDEIWLTFSEPQVRDGKGTKRITSPVFMRRYERFLVPGGLVHVKTDSTFLYERTLSDLRAAGYEITIASDDVYGRLVHEVPDDLREVLEVNTQFERKWLKQGKRIRYLQVKTDSGSHCN
jgi:tRNA (guanine-N7-)-methyltransferase